LTWENAVDAGAMELFVIVVGEDDDASWSGFEWQVGQQVEAATAAGTDADDEDIDGTEAEGLEGASGGTPGDDVRVSLQAARDASAAEPVSKYEYPGDVLPLALGLLGGPNEGSCFGVHARRSTSSGFDAVRTAYRRRRDEHGLARNSRAPSARAIGAPQSRPLTTTTRSSRMRTPNRRCSRTQSFGCLRSADGGGEASRRTVGEPAWL
jgi:hypothetical protein